LDSVVDIMIKKRTAQSRFSNPCKETDSPLQNDQTGYEYRLTSCSEGTGNISPDIKRMGSEFNHPVAPTAKVQMSGAIPSCHLYEFMSCRV